MKIKQTETYFQALLYYYLNFLDKYYITDKLIV